MRPNISTGSRAYRTMHSGLAKRSKYEEDPHLLTPHPAPSPHHSRINGARGMCSFIHLSIPSSMHLLPYWFEAPEHFSFSHQLRPVIFAAGLVLRIIHSEFHQLTPVGYRSPVANSPLAHHDEPS